MNDSSNYCRAVIISDSNYMNCIPQRKTVEWSWNVNQLLPMRYLQFYLICSVNTYLYCIFLNTMVGYQYRYTATPVPPQTLPLVSQEEKKSFVPTQSSIV